MKSYVTFNADGTVASAGIGPYPPADAFPFAPPLEAAGLAGMMLVPRPELGAVTRVDGVFTTPALPAGTEVEVLDNSGSEQLYHGTVAEAEAGTTLSFDLTDPGSYEISITPPRPYMPISYPVTVPEPEGG